MIGSTMKNTADDDRQQTSYAIPPVTRAFALLRYIAAGNSCRNVSNTAKEVGINRTTAIRLLATLEAEGMIETIDKDGGYRLGTGLITLASNALSERGAARVARPILAQLAADLNLSAHLSVREGREIVYLVRETPNSHLVSNVREGTRFPAHATSIGRILLAQLSEKELDALYAGVELKSYSDKTRTSLESLKAQLKKDRELGISWSSDNFEPGIGSAAMAVYDHTGEVAGAINVTGHSSAFTQESGLLGEIEDRLRKAARLITEALGHR